MALTIIPQLTKIYDAESTTGWTLNKGDTYSGFQREGSYCIGDQVSATSGHFYKTISSTNLSNTHIYSWMMVWGNVDTKANGGFRIVVGDGTNRRAYYVGGSDDYGLRYGAWSCFAMSTSNPPANYQQLAGSSEPNWSAITEIGVGFKVLSKAIGSVPNVFWDVCHYGIGLKVVGGTSSDPATFSQIANEDASTSNAWGIIVEDKPGIFYIQGKLLIGDEGGTYDTYFEDKNVTVIFLDKGFESGAYEIEIRGNSSTSTTVILGEKAGTVGINGVLLSGGGNANFVFDAYTYSSDIDQLGIYGSTFLNMGSVYLPNKTTNVEVLNTSFTSGGRVYAYQCPMKYCSFINADTDALWIPTNHNVADSNFISNPVAVYLDNTGDYTFDNLQFNGNTYDIENATSGTINIYAVNGSNPSTYTNTGGGTTNIINSVYVTVYVKDSDTNPISGASVFVYNMDDSEVILNTTTDENGKAETTYNYVGDRNLLIRVRKSSPGNTRYIPVRTYGVLTSIGFTTTVVLTQDTNI